MIGEFVDPEDEVWQLYIYLRNIIDIAMSPKMADSDILLLEYYVSMHNQQYRKVFNENLKFKFHSLLHYARMIRKHGPLVKCCVMNRSTEK